ncbi:hypothetical protein COCMIDRAFT_3424 [Bipolaris oryzae ATCC 44560]|uniref:N-acetyltransferase domain-containing protein n=1 Tax=Bipolaris oryzae ATCC 44560 TaxID=930090 RepID=W6ZJH6_COCMI|nr:uncharacterized protein COCMIDRAFT_3424 [Bipolaris oryzae ATCC 44560]EUC47629.1 hypothetical protein COCMIDRAFT_3424 [Bipolaris oryzae ATCC 44560]
MRFLTCAVLLPFVNNPVCNISSLSVHSVKYADIPSCVALRTETLGSLVIGRPPPYPGYQEDQISSIRDDLANKKNVYHLKVIDKATDDEIVAYAKWEIYEHGRPDLEGLKQPMDEVSKQVDQYGRLREAAHQYFCSRNGELGKHPHILLELLVTSSKHRRRGAGSLLVQWGLAKSEELQLPVFLQASAQGQQLVQNYGFETIDRVKFTLADYGLTGTELMSVMIRYPPKNEANEALICG